MNPCIFANMDRNKLSYASDSKNSANDTVLSLTLRQLHGVFGGIVFWAVNGVAVMLLAMAGPYYTLERLSFAERLVYWGTTVILSALIMTTLSILAYRLGTARGWHWALTAFGAGCIGAFPVFASVYLAEGTVEGFAPGWVSEQPFARLFAYTAPTVIAVTMVVNIVIRYQTPETEAEAEAEDVADAAPTRPPLTLLQSKLPHHLGHEIISVRAQDHYVEVTTPHGSAMVLMRLGDAIADLGPLPGLQVHRSWWVSLAHVEREERGPNGPELELSSGQRVPVGRSFRSALSAAKEA